MPVFTQYSFQSPVATDTSPESDEITQKRIISCVHLLNSRIELLLFAKFSGAEDPVFGLRGDHLSRTTLY